MAASSPWRMWIIFCAIHLPTEFLRRAAPRSIHPILIPDRQPVQIGLAGSPLGQVLVHQGDEPRSVRPLQQMDHFVHDDVLEALRRFLGQSVFKRIVRALHCSFPDPFPLRDQLRRGLLDLVAIPFVQHGALPLQRRLFGPEEIPARQTMIPQPVGIWACKEARTQETAQQLVGQKKYAKSTIDPKH